VIDIKLFIGDEDSVYASLEFSIIKETSKIGKGLLSSKDTCPSMFQSLIQYSRLFI